MAIYKRWETYQLRNRIQRAVQSIEPKPAAEASRVRSRPHVVRLGLAKITVALIAQQSAA